MRPVYLHTLFSLSMLTLVVGCGSSNQSSLADTSAFSRAQPATVSMHSPMGQIATDKARAAFVVRAAQTPTAVQLLDWAEVTYPTLFPTTPQRPTHQTFETYLFRYYPTNDWLLAVNQADGGVLGIVDVSTPSPRVLPLGSLSGFSCVVFPNSCTAASPVVFDKTTVTSGSSEVSAFMNVCDPTSPRTAVQRSDTTTLSSLPNLQEMQRALAATRASASPGTRSYTSSRPADSLGPCGGRMSYTSYSHVNGITTATRQFTNYCTTDSSTGKQQFTNGTMNFVNRATPTSNGPITTQFTAQSPSGITFETRNAGILLTSQTYKFTNYVHTPGVPGGTATSTQPDRVDLEELTSTNNINGKAYRQTGYSMAYFSSANGGEQVTLSGRGYRSNGQYYDMMTTSPVLTNSDGDYVSGVFTFVGAGNSKTTATIVPGSVLQTTLAVDGSAVTGLPACSP